MNPLLLNACNGQLAKQGGLNIAKLYKLTINNERLLFLLLSKIY